MMLKHGLPFLPVIILSLTTHATTGLSFQFGELRSSYETNVTLSPQSANVTQIVRKGRNRRAVGGWRSKVPYAVAVIGNKQGKHDSFICSGSIIADSWILTAAHCFVPNVRNVRVVAGTDDLNHHRECFVPASQVFRHPYFLPPAVHDDIALIKLAVPLSHCARDRMRLILLPMKSWSIPVGLTATLTGFGATGNHKKDSQRLLHSVNVSVQHDEHCSRHFPVYDASLMVCAGGEAGKGSCDGDSGGPLVARVSDKDFLIGLSSYGSKRCAISIPDVYTRVSHYIDWIERTISSHSM